MTVNKERKEGREEQQDKLKIKSVRSADNRSYNFLYNEDDDCQLKLRSQVGSKVRSGHRHCENVVVVSEDTPPINVLKLN
jgi:hypothetical protein